MWYLTETIPYSNFSVHYSTYLAHIVDIKIINHFYIFNIWIFLSLENQRFSLWFPMILCTVLYSAFYIVCVNQLPGGARFRQSFCILHEQNTNIQIHILARRTKFSTLKCVVSLWVRGHNAVSDVFILIITVIFSFHTVIVWIT